jgi:hypothetical protein
MSRGLVRPNFPLPPAQYDSRYMAEIVRQFSVFIQQVQNPGDERFTTVTITQLPTNDVGLEQGSLYNHGGFVKVSELDTSSVAGSGMVTTAGTVTVSIS